MGPLSVLDDHSRYLIALAATGGTHGEPAQQQLEEAFQRCGVPEAMLMDHGTPWWSTHAQFGEDAVVIVADAAGHSAVLERYSASTNPGQDGTLSRIVAAGMGETRSAGAEPASLAGCVSLGAQPRTTARSAGNADSGERCGAPVCIATIPIRRVGNIPIGVWVLKVDCQGKLDIQGTKWKINRSLAGEWVQVVRVEQGGWPIHSRLFANVWGYDAACTTE